MRLHSELLSLKNNVAIITGGAKGIGYGIAYRLAEAGANVVIADIDANAAIAATSSIHQKGWIAEPIKVDVAKEQEIAHMVRFAQEKFGRLDILVNNAGIYPPKPVEQMSEDDFEKVMHVNLRSVFLATKYAAKVMKEQKSGKIINVTSIDALHPSMIGLAHYDASKHGVWGFTKNSALELAKYNIWVNAIAPGGITTPGVQAMNQGAPTSADVTEQFMAKIPMHRMGDADEIGKVVLFLASDMSSYMTGSQIVVDGGALLS